MARIRSILPILAVVVLWEFVSSRMGERAPLFPGPLKCLQALIGWASGEDLAGDLIASGRRLVFGFIIGSALGCAAGTATGTIRWFELALVPIIRLFRSLPPVAMLPLVIVWFGIDERAQIIAIATGVFFNVWIATHTGIQGIPIDTLRAASLLERNKWVILFRVKWPACLPSTLGGLRVGLATAVVMVFVSELLGTDAGLGYKISIWQLAYRMDAMIAGLVLLAVVGALADLSIVAAAQACFRWLPLGTAAGAPQMGRGGR